MYAHETSLVGSIGVVSATAALKGILDKNKIIRHEISTSDKLVENRFDVFGSSEINEEQV